MAEPNIAEAERNANLFAIAEAQPYKWRSQISQKPSAMQVYSQLPRRNRINGGAKYRNRINGGAKYRNRINGGAKYTQSFYYIV